MKPRSITRRHFVNTLGKGTIAASLAPMWRLNNNAVSKPPNVVLILADDMGWSDPGCYGGEIFTPNIDHLAQNGVRYTQFHNTAKCFPSRACLLTGLYAQQTGMDERPLEIRNAVTFGEVLKGAGYRTLMVGKHHGTENPYTRGFDRYYGLRDGACNYFNPGKQRPGEGIPAQKRPEKRVWCIDDKTLIPYTPEERGFYTTDYFTNHAISYLEQYKHEDKPFLLYVAYTAPHDPLQAWPEDIRKYQDRYKAGWDRLRKERYQRQLDLGIVDNTAPLSIPSYESWDDLSPEKKDEESRKMAVYAAMIARMDQNIGRLLVKLREIDKEENTLILFASDNGCSAEIARATTSSGEIGSMTRWSSLGPNWANASNTPYRFYKNFSHEGGICTPLIAYWPKFIKKRGRISNQVGHFIDIMPTLVDISGAVYPKTSNGETIPPFEGESLLPSFNGSEKPRERPLFWQWSRGKAVMQGKWKLVSWENKWELFDIEKDRTETNDLSALYPDRVANLQALYDEWLVDYAAMKH